MPELIVNAAPGFSRQNKTINPQLNQIMEKNSLPACGKVMENRCARY